jgi:hypothetical protein
MLKKIKWKDKLLLTSVDGAASIVTLLKASNWKETTAFLATTKPKMLQDLLSHCPRNKLQA